MDPDTEQNGISKDTFKKVRHLYIKSLRQFCCSFLDSLKPLEKYSLRFLTKTVMVILRKTNLQKHLQTFQSKVSAAI